MNGSRCLSGKVNKKDKRVFNRLLISADFPLKDHILDLGDILEPLVGDLISCRLDLIHAGSVLENGLDARQVGLVYGMADLG